MRASRLKKTPQLINVDRTWSLHSLQTHRRYAEMCPRRMYSQCWIGPKRTIAKSVNEDKKAPVFLYFVFGHEFQSVIPVNTMCKHVNIPPLQPVFSVRINSPPPFPSIWLCASVSQPSSSHVAVIHHSSETVNTGRGASGQRMVTTAATYLKKKKSRQRGR